MTLPYLILTYLTHFTDGKNQEAELAEAILFRATVGKEWPPVPQPRALPLLNLHPESCGGFETTNTQEGILPEWVKKGSIKGRSEGPQKATLASSYQNKESPNWGRL